MAKKGMNQYILAILCIIALVAIVLFVTGKTSWVYVSESSLTGEAYTGTGYKVWGTSCKTVACGGGETVVCYQSENGCTCPPCSSVVEK